MVFEFEVEPREYDSYLEEAAGLRPCLAQVDGFVSVERFESQATPGRFVAIGYFRDEDAVARWRNLPEHRRVQALGRSRFFAGYRLVMAHVLRDYTHHLRDTVPADSKLVHDGRSA
jgi:heme-degrading monooxygenase HmoA